MKGQIFNRPMVVVLQFVCKKADVHVYKRQFTQLSAYDQSIYYAIFKNEIYIGRLHYGGRIYEKFYLS